MKYRSRKKHRDCANFILGKLFDKSPNHDLFLTQDDWMDPHIPALSIHSIKSQTTEYDLTEIKRAIRLLLANEHVSIVNTGNPAKEVNPEHPPTLILTLSGRDAFLDDYYKILNKRDFLESFELWAKWVLPVLAIIISILALVISFSKR